jgi:hypothetical protein
MIIMILLTLMALTSMQVTLLQERMSGNYRAQQQAFERSEGRMAEGRDKTSDVLWAYDHVSDIPIALTSANATPWLTWLNTFPPEEHFEQAIHVCGGACPERRGSIVGDDPNKKPRYYVITGQEKDPASVADNAAWATVQTMYVF